MERERAQQAMFTAAVIPEPNASRTEARVPLGRFGAGVAGLCNTRGQQLFGPDDKQLNKHSRCAVRAAVRILPTYSLVLSLNSF